MDNNFKISIPASLATKELKDIKTRQLARKEEGIPKNITNDMMYQMLMDVLENQARIENKLNNILNQS